MRSVAVIGAGWAGLAAAVRLQAAGRQVTLFEASSSPGGRARTITHQGLTHDNGQHILIGAYSRTLALMKEVGVEPGAALHRRPLALIDPDGRGLRLPSGPALPALLWGLLRLSHWPIATRMAWIGRATRWMLQGMRCSHSLSVADLCAGLPTQVMEELVDPLCVAALNTESREASGAVFLRVLRDALMGGRGSADLMLPRQPLGQLLPEPAVAWLTARGAEVRWRHRVMLLTAGASDSSGSHWQVDGQPFDAVILACPPWEAARMIEALVPAWAAAASAMRHEPITTVTLEAAGRASLGAPMVRLTQGPAQFAFDLAALGHTLAASAGEGGEPRRRFTFVISAATPWLEQGGEAIEQAVLAQARSACTHLSGDTSLRVLARLTEKRATFRCLAGLHRPSPVIAPGLWASGDYVEGPYPATLEGAVRSGEHAAQAILIGR
jgi:squalene-associated FAD-dependent desaturase